ncbi:hypothetical protein PIROE2DRAFT_62231 [Piromyces sp. E2]|nr:hypothetical protein PIROE2DRAFT_62231 [Piromyces sp. E2]|eukprot:OUM61909.1 hypothetical protein PIROE2DRAFT_62231 [Piromyces sp. E2]
MDNIKDSFGNNNKDYERLTTPKPVVNNEEVTSLLSSTDYDLNHDVVMKSHVTNFFSQVPDSGCFDVARRYLSLEVNFVTSKLRGASRNWYLVKYPANNVPTSMKELLESLKVAFNDVSSSKLAKKINEFKTSLWSSH